MKPASVAGCQAPAGQIEQVLCASGCRAAGSLHYLQMADVPAEGCAYTLMHELFQGLPGKRYVWQPFRLFWTHLTLLDLPDSIECYNCFVGFRAAF